MIRVFIEGSRDQREFAEYMQKLRNQPPRPPYVPGPTNWEELMAIARQVPQEDRDALVEIIREMKHR